jgi:Raf kinase inhibitor-like YbhB/YbcL family protein
MRETLPAGIGHALLDVRAGYDKVVSEDPRFAAAPQTIVLRSPTFLDGRPLPARHTSDGEGLSPPLRWTGAPPEAVSLVLIVEDADAPAPEPLVHLIAWNLPVGGEGLEEAAFPSRRRAGRETEVGRDAFAHVGWLPPDPPRGHGPHLYAFQMFALDRRLSFAGHPGRSAMVAAMKGRVLARGVLLGTCERR